MNGFKRDRVQRNLVSQGILRDSPGFLPFMEIVTFKTYPYSLNTVNFILALSIF